MQKINTIIVDDHALFRLGLRTAIEKKHPDIVIAAEAQNGAEFLSLLDTTAVDIVILDILLPDIHGVEIARRLKNERPEIKILAVSCDSSTSTVKEMLDIGIEGFISKFDSTMDTFADAIRAIMQGLEYYGTDIFLIMRKIYLAQRKTDLILPEFSNQEKRIIEYCHKGFTGQQIADSLNIAYKTMEWHKSNIFRKLGIHSTAELVQFVVNNGIII